MHVADGLIIGRGVVRPAWPSDDIRLPTHQHNKQWIFMIPIPAGKWLLRTEWIVLRDASVSYLEDPSKGAEVNTTAGRGLCNMC